MPSSDDKEVEKEEEEEEEEEEEPLRVTRSRRTSPRRRAARRGAYKEEDTNDEEEEYEEEDNQEEDSVDKVVKQPKKRRGRAKGNAKKKQRRSSGKKVYSDSDRTCPHCDKTFSVIDGLRYHLKNFVCRPNERPGGPAKRGKRKRKEGDGDPKKKKYKRIRGSLEDRTCSNCGRVFTSTLGLSYHVEKRVCEKGTPQQKGKEPEKPFDTLEAGAQFVTSYGIVQVVKDDRAIPTAELPKNAKALSRARQDSMKKRDAEMRKKLSVAAVRNRVRRSLLHELYEKDNLRQDTVFEAYFGAKDPLKIPPEDYPAIVPSSPETEDPCAPAESYPDRIVECLIIADKRNHFVGDDTSNETEPRTVDGMTGTRLFLQRRLLTEPYYENTDSYSCLDCGQCFASKPGCKYHMQSNVCKQKDKRAKEAAAQHIQEIEKRAEQLLDRKKPPGQESSAKRSPAKRSLAKRHPGRMDLSMYPEVWLSLGFKPQSRTRATKSVIASEKDDEGADDNFESPDIVLARLKAELRFEQAKSLGPMYAPVFAALRYKPYRTKKEEDKEKQKARKAKQLKRKRKQQERELKRKWRKEKKARKKAKMEQKKQEQELPRKPPPPIIDVRALVGEVDAGRYPSMKRFENGTHEDACAICKSNGDKLLPCNFCAKVVHMPCILTKFTVKEPEPDDDFMCNGCIACIAARRARAEKRRVQRYGNDDNQLTNPEAMRLTKEVVAGMEYECVAAQGRQLNELGDLLRDAQARLTQNMEIAKMNRVRCAAIAPQETNAAL